MQKGHEREKQRLGQRRSSHAAAKAALNIVSSPEGCDIFLPSLLAVLISLHMSWMKIEFVWKRGRHYWLYYSLLIVCMRMSASVHLCSFVRICVHVRVKAVSAPEPTNSEQQWIVFLSYIIVNAAHLCGASLFNGQDPNLECTKDLHSPFLSTCPLAFRSVFVLVTCVNVLFLF